STEVPYRAIWRCNFTGSAPEVRDGGRCKRLGSTSRYSGSLISEHYTNLLPLAWSVFGELNTRPELLPEAGARQLDRDKARCTMHVSSSPPFRTRRATCTAPGSAPTVLLQDKHPEAFLRISPAPRYAPWTACAFAGDLCSSLSIG